ncbi:hypothetical protein CU098_006221, partial [Rhizopus stolonifer]
MAEPEIDEALLLDWTTAIEALDYDTIQELLEHQPQLLWTPLQPVHLESDFAHFIQRLESFKLLGTSLRPVYALHHILFDYGLPGDEWANERTVLVDFILKNTKGNELNTCLWGAEKNTPMHLAYLLNQPTLTQQLLDKGCLTNIPNKLGHLPTQEQKDDQPKLLVNKSKAKEAKAPVNTSDRFRRLRELAEAPHDKNSKVSKERQNSTRRYFRPGHLEEKKRRILNEEEEELEKQRLRRQKDIELLAQRSAVKNNPLFKKFEEQNQKKETKAPAPVIPAVRDRQKLLGVNDPIKRSSRVINSLKNNSYVSSSVFRQQTEEPKNLQVPTLAQLRLGPKESLVEDEDSSKSTESNATTTEQADSILSLDNESIKSSSSSSLKQSDASIKSSSSSSLKQSDASVKSPEASLKSPTGSTFSFKSSKSASLKSPTSPSFDKKSYTLDRVTMDEVESLSIGKLPEKKLIDIGPSKVKQIVNVHETLNVKEEVEIYTVGKKFAVWKRDTTDGEQQEEDSHINLCVYKDKLSSESQSAKEATTKQRSLLEKEEERN